MSDILKLETFKACQDTDIPTKIVKENANIFANVLASNFDYYIEKSSFPSILKNASITSVFKVDDRNSKDNHRPVAMLPITSKIFDRCIFLSITQFYGSSFVKKPMWFSQRLQQYCLLAILEK